MMARTCILRSWKSLLAIMAVFLLPLALPCGIAHAAETISAAGLMTESVVESPRVLFALSLVKVSQMVFPRESVSMDGFELSWDSHVV